MMEENIYDVSRKKVVNIIKGFFYSYTIFNLDLMNSDSMHSRVIFYDNL